MYESSRAKADLLAAMLALLADKDGPLRLERVGARVAGVPWGEVSPDDRRILGGVFARCGFESQKWPHWYRVERRAAA
jgi:hypothetical protein